MWELTRVDGGMLQGAHCSDASPPLAFGASAGIGNSSYRVLWQVCSLVQPSISWFLRGLRRRIILLSSIDKSTTMCPCARVTVAIPKVTSNARKLKHASHTGGLSRSWSATGTHSSTLYLSKGCVWTDSCLYKSITNPCRPEGALVC